MANRGPKGFMQNALERFKVAAEEENDNRKLALDDLKFRAGDQWDGKVKSDRDQDNRPCLTINQLPQFIRQVTNEQRQNRAAIKVSPTGSGATVETAQVFQGMIRHIEYDSNADIAYDTAGQSAVTSGLGYFRIITDYESDDSFDQEIKFKRIRNPFMVYADPSSQEPDGSDMNWCFIATIMDKDTYKRKYPKSELGTMSDWQSIGDQVPGWVDDEGCRIVEYFVKEYEPKTLVMWPDGTRAFLEDYPEENREKLLGFAKMKRTVQVPKIMWYKLNGIEILDETEWLGRWIPVVPVLGDELDVDGRRILEGIVRHAKDPARMYNYWVSAETEMIALAPKAPYIGAAGQFDGYEEMWKAANRRNMAYLEYNPKSSQGTLIPAPQRNQYEPPIQAINHARMASRDDLKATTGIYASSLGEQGNEQTGRAILARQHQGQISNFHYIDNMTRAIRHAGRILVDLIPKIYDTERVVRIVEPDGNQRMVTVNGAAPQPTDPSQPPTPDQPMQNGVQIDATSNVQRIYQLGVGKYDVVVEGGPSYRTKREEALASLLQLSQNYPKLMDVAGDIVIGTMDWEGALEISQRIKKTLPPGVADDPSGGQQMPPAAIQKIQGMEQMIDGLTKALHAAQDERDKWQAELNSKEELEIAKLKTQITIKQMELDQADAHKIADLESAELDRQLSAMQARDKSENDANKVASQVSEPYNEASDSSGSPEPTQAG